MGNVIQFRPRPKTPRIERRSILPAQAIKAVRPEPAGDPVAYTQKGNVFLDLGNCTRVRTVLKLSPDAARVWAFVLLSIVDELEE